MGLNLGVDRITKLLIEKKLLGLEEIITKTNKIVRASDGLEQFEEALNYAITLAKSYSYKILGVYVKVVSLRYFYTNPLNLMSHIS